MVTPLQIVAPTVLNSGADTLLYTVGPNLALIIKKLTFANTTAGALTVTVTFNGTGDANTIKKVRTLQADETWECYEAENHILNSGGTLHALASGAGITATASGLLVS